MNHISKLALALIACALCATPALAQDGTLKKIKDTGYITVGHRDASIPFSYLDDKQQPARSSTRSRLNSKCPSSKSNTSW